MKKLLMSLLAVSSLAVAGVATVQADAQDNPTFETFGAKKLQLNLSTLIKTLLLVKSQTLIVIDM
ncbi:hypothetical protein GYM70_00465 [Lactobacillus panisapium]|nr:MULTISPECIES: hypothetical protein [Lactobacillus]MCX8725792.1 hypothetical protein [Lactobacillus sp. B4007]QYN53959.1 hypothetical protein GYM70_00465 [Lactobacillus panisapium]